MKSLTVYFVTAREQPEVRWFLWSLANQYPGTAIQATIIDSLKPVRPLDTYGFKVRHYTPKPSYWAGASRLTKSDWWNVAGARNTALCLCETEWVAFLDDRCVLMPGWLNAIERAMEGNYIVAGAYEKRVGMVVDDHGVIKDSGTLIGEDSRLKYVTDNKIETPFKCPGEWIFGCSLALPLEWALKVNGYSELLSDGIGYEDVYFGLMLGKNGFPVKYDPSMKMIEDRTPGMIGPVVLREDKGKSPDDKSHAALAIAQTSKFSWNSFDLREMRAGVQAGNPFPQPAENFADDWYDREDLKLK